jgi:hypothetical protein
VGRFGNTPSRFLMTVLHVALTNWLTKSSKTYVHSSTVLCSSFKAALPPGSRCPRVKTRLRAPDRLSGTYVSVRLLPNGRRFAADSLGAVHTTYANPVPYLKYCAKFRSSAVELLSDSNAPFYSPFEWNSLYYRDFQRFLRRCTTSFQVLHKLEE